MHASLCTLFLKVCLVLAAIALSYGVSRNTYPKLCNNKYSECLKDGQINSLECASKRVACLMKYCLNHVKHFNTHRKKSSSEIKQKIAECVAK